MSKINYRGSIKYAEGLKSLNSNQENDAERLRLLRIYQSLNRSQRLLLSDWIQKGYIENLTEGLNRMPSLNAHQCSMVEGWLKKGRVNTLEEGLIKIMSRIAQDNEQGKKGAERG